MLRRSRLLALHVRQPRRQGVALLHNALQLLRGDVAICVARVLCRCAVVGDGTFHSIDPVLSHLILLESEDHWFTQLFQLIKLLNVLHLGGIKVVVQPVLCLHQLRLKLLPISGANECAILTSFTALVPHGENVGLEVISFLIRLDDLLHVSLHGRLLILLQAQDLLWKSTDVTGDDGDVCALGALLLLDDLDPLHLLLGFLLG
mmetsp:Transcript_60352/g.73948  ORF Transcript_60352/g.73948 Transcript_60352/m.73948 type:complete len:204 (+) Transcript_60352:160-771(+)